jgi:nucleotide-binding universal stress UspA family protein
MTMLDYVAAGVAAGPRVVVGVSGSRSSIGALCWAAREAAQRRGLVVAVMAWQPPRAAHYAVSAVRHDQAKQREAADIRLAAIVRAAFGDEIPGHLVTEVVEDTAEHALIGRSAEADLLVLGAMPAPAHIARPVGPVIRACLGRARCPVVIIRTGQAGGDPADRCVDGSASSAGRVVAAMGATR